MEIKGLSIQDIMDMGWDELNRLTPKDLRIVTSRLVSASNKRIRSLTKASEKEFLMSFGLEQTRKMGRQFTIRNKNIAQVKNEFKMAKSFLQKQTSTVKGAKRYTMSMKIRTGQVTENESRSWSESTWGKYWKVYRMFEENHHGTFKKGDSERIQQMLTEIMNSNDKRKSAYSFQQMIEDEYEDIYEREQEQESEDIDDYFDLGE